uniref:Uncharacterized protein n=1 Tax=Glossina palpalis gambiensis TaxID=67801 RepID=A0A1B0B342_9MUSC
MNEERRRALEQILIHINSNSKDKNIFQLQIVQQIIFIVPLVTFNKYYKKTVRAAFSRNSNTTWSSFQKIACRVCVPDYRQLARASKESRHIQTHAGQIAIFYSNFSDPESSRNT